MNARSWLRGFLLQNEPRVLACGLGGGYGASIFAAMGRYIFIIFLIGAIPWAIATLWEMHRSHGPRERAWVGRASVALWFSCLIGSILFFQIGMKNMLFALPVFIIAGLGARAGMRRVRARIRMEEGDPLSRARRLN